MNIVMVKL